ncbi:MAG: DUF3368 domain-containing protein [Candidatus Thiothrix sulfatifontis]|nr:MAG: DUF3368 domain-containing protein [Candidatus Thiothrix sulfatifontis]
MIVIADSSALVAVSTYRGLDLLETLFGTVLVPTAVYKATAANLMLVDDLRAKKSAYTNGLETMGSLGLLLLAKEEGLIADITSRVRLLQNSNAYLNPMLIEQVLQRAGE